MACNAIDQIVRLREYPSQHKDCEAAPQPQNLFVYCSTPRPLLEKEVSGGPYGRPLYRDNVPKPQGMHSYYNISWDPRVRRGDPLQLRKRREELECEKIRRKLTEPRKRTEKKLTKEEKLQARRLSDPQQMIRAANMRYARLAISNLRPTEKVAFLVELTDEVDQDELCYKGQRIGPAKVFPKVPSQKRNLVDKACQIIPGDFFQFDTEVVPILERLIGQVCYRARMEVLEEAELAALKLERELHEEQKRKEIMELIKFKTQVERHLEEEQRQVALARQQMQDEALGKTSSSLYAGVYVKYGNAEGTMALGEEWQFFHKLQEVIGTEFVGWVNEQVEQKMELHYLSRRLLDEIIRNSVSEKEAQAAASIWKDVFNEEPVRAYSGDVDSKVPPPTPGTSEYTSDEEGRNRGREYLNTSDYYARDYDMSEE